MNHEPYTIKLKRPGTVRYLGRYRTGALRPKERPVEILLCCELLARLCGPGLFQLIEIDSAFAELGVDRHWRIGQAELARRWPCFHFDVH